MVSQDLMRWIRTSFSPAVGIFQRGLPLYHILWMQCTFLYQSDMNFFLTSADVPEGSFIIRAHTPMSNLFSCLWFNEVERFTPRDQLSFAYTYQKLRRMNPGKPFRLNMFKVKLSIELFLRQNEWELHE